MSKRDTKEIDFTVLEDNEIIASGMLDISDKDYEEIMKILGMED